MENLFVSYKISKALKQLKFDEPCFGWYSNIDKGVLRIKNTVKYQGTNYCGIESCWLAPTHQQVIDWIRDKYGIEFYIVPMLHIGNKNIVKKKDGYRYNFYNCIGDDYTKIHNESSERYNTYYEALNGAIEQALKKIKNVHRKSNNNRSRR